MTLVPDVEIIATDLDALKEFSGRITVFVPSDGRLDAAARRVNRLCRGAIVRFATSEAFAALKPGEARDIAYPSGMAAEAVQVVRLERTASTEELRKAGAAAGAARGKQDVLVLASARKRTQEIALGMMLRAYAFDACKSGEAANPAKGAMKMMVNDPEPVVPEMEAVRALAEGVFMTRDLVNLPANLLTTTEFADRLEALRELGVEVEVLDEAALADLGMTMLLGVGQGSESPSKVVVMQWKGGGDEAPLALIGKGVVFDTGGISLKPGAGMEDMTMDMGGAGVVAGVMRAIAGRKAKANVVGLVGLVENMPDGKAQRPGDIVTSMKGDTVEVINTDAEGRLVLGDVMWYAQERFNPVGMIDLATLTGAIIVSLGHDNAGVFSNNDDFCNAFLKAASVEGEGAWRMPLGESYASLLKSQKADVKNVGTRWGGAITAAEFLHRFVKDDTPWIHLDIAGVAQPAAAPPLAPKGASGWGVLALDRLIRNGYEAG
ncbi:leucyl aminopeptidase [Tropicimonas sediminicola]|uniref:Probable cytosol aminopeptidase n=1 Tax=Tropicimonas sediminicola TaxID=1031541 RepID=A0A239EJQ3_9RHOB|nr:leucyl aminopeptidase [Tropicimonas sediminicola]SNS44263.1 leucyl aminopeptidase [Tropicimonas sediminicola]